jgi:hypothetical protein
MKQSTNQPAFFFAADRFLSKFSNYFNKKYRSLQQKTIYLVISNNKSIANLTKKNWSCTPTTDSNFNKKKVVDNNNLR